MLSFHGHYVKVFLNIHFLTLIVELHLSFVAHSSNLILLTASFIRGNPHFKRIFTPISENDCQLWSTSLNTSRFKQYI